MSDFTDAPSMQIFGPHRGRPARAEAPSLTVTVRLSPDERSRVIQAAELSGQSLTQFVRDVCVAAADEVVKELSDVHGFRTT